MDFYGLSATRHFSYIIWTLNFLCNILYYMFILNHFKSVFLIIIEIHCYNELKTFKIAVSASIAIKFIWFVGDFLILRNERNNLKTKSRSNTYSLHMTILPEISPLNFQNFLTFMDFYGHLWTFRYTTF